MRVLVRPEVPPSGPMLRVMMQRPSIWSDYWAIYNLVMETARKGQTFSNRDITRWMFDVDGKQHSPSMVSERMERYYLNRATGVGMSVDRVTAAFVGWRRTA